jgi:hypothetical protein
MAKLDGEDTRSDFGKWRGQRKQMETGMETKEPVAISTVILDENDSEYRQQVGFEARNLRAKANEREMVPSRRQGEIT